MFLGHIVQHLALDPRDRTTLVLATRTGHLGPTVFRSTDLGQTWQEATRPPAFAGGDPLGRSLNAVFWLSAGHASEPGAWYAGGSPQGLFRSGDGGDTWEPVSGWNDHERWPTWAEWPDEGTPDGSMLHSVIVDPRDAAHLYIGLSGGGVFESHDAGGDWHPLNAGCVATFLPDPDPEFGHDPHCVRLHPLRPDRLYQQNHCGIYRMERAVGPMGTDRRQHASRRRRHRVPDRVAPARPRHRVGVPDGRHRRVAAHEPRWPSVGVRDARRRRSSWAARRRRAAGASVVHGEAPGHDGRHAANRSASTSARPAARSGRVPTRAARGRASREHLPEIYSVEHADPA